MEERITVMAFNLISEYPGASALTFGAFFAAVAYFYKDRVERKRNLKSALYILLEIWHRMAIFYVESFDPIFDRLIEYLEREVVKSKLPESEKARVKEHFSPILTETIHSAAFSDFETYATHFERAVRLISIDYPIFAYEIGSVSNSKRFLKSVDEYLEKSLSPMEASGESNFLFSQIMKKEVNSQASLDRLQDLEKTVRRLSWRVGISNYCHAIRVMHKRKSKLKYVSDQDIKDISKSLIPVIAEFGSQTAQKKTEAPRL